MTVKIEKCQFSSKIRDQQKKIRHLLEVLKLAIEENSPCIGANALAELTEILEKRNDIGAEERVEFAFKNALNEIAECHSSEDVEEDGTMCFSVTCGCDFCEQWKILNEQQ